LLVEKFARPWAHTRTRTRWVDGRSILFIYGTTASVHFSFSIPKCVRATTVVVVYDDGIPRSLRRPLRRSDRCVGVPPPRPRSTPRGHRVHRRRRTAGGSIRCDRNVVRVRVLVLVRVRVCAREGRARVRTRRRLVRTNGGGSSHHTLSAVHSHTPSRRTNFPAKTRAVFILEPPPGRRIDTPGRSFRPLPRVKSFVNDTSRVHPIPSAPSPPPLSTRHQLCTTRSSFYDRTRKTV